MDNKIPKINTNVVVTNVIKETKQQYFLSCHNIDTARGQYYAEDDWDIIGCGDTLDILFLDFAKTYFGDNIYNTKVYPSSWEFGVAEISEYKENEKIIKTDFSKILETDKKTRHYVVDMFLQSSFFKEEETKYYQKIKDEKEKKEKQDREKKEKQDREKKEKQDRELLKKLKEEYESIPDK